jgi:hypothetical protein
MHDVDHAMTVLRERTGLHDLTLNRSGLVEMVFDDDLVVRFHRVDENALELVAKIGSLGATPTVDRLTALLFANHLGQTTGPARIAVDRHDGAIVLGERLNVKDLDAGALENRLLAFVQYAKTWASGRVEALLAEPDAPSSTVAAPGGDFIVRA